MSKNKIASDAELGLHGVNGTTLIGELKKGMSFRKFTIALRAGLLNVAAFNNRTADSTPMEVLLDNVLHMRRFRRTYSAVNRSLIGRGDMI